jgi:HK97 gp10 family phage protein
VTTAKVLGLAKLERKIKRLPIEVKTEIRRAMERAAERMTAMMRNLVPVDDGDLKASIGWTWGKPPRGSLTIGKLIGSNLGKELTLTIFAGDEKAFYARWVEFGTQAHEQPNRGVSHPGASAQPFFFVAYRANKRSARSTISRAVSKAARKVAAQ